jgi:hypothetical protein
VRPAGAEEGSLLSTIATTLQNSSEREFATDSSPEEAVRSEPVSEMGVVSGDIGSK